MSRVLCLLLLLMTLLTACVDPLDLRLGESVDVVVVDGALTNLNEPQFVWLRRAKSINGRFGTLPLKGATVEILVDSLQRFRMREIEPGKYQAPDGFVGQVGRRYQLEFRLEDGTTYRSRPEVLPEAPPISKMTVRFNPESFGPTERNGYRSAHEVQIDTQDPAGQRNFYRWDWALYEKQDWCKTCYQGVYAVYKILPRQYLFNRYYVSGTELYENCFSPEYDPNSQTPPPPNGDFYYDYRCRTECWAIIRNHELNLFDDAFTDGGRIEARRVGQLPFFTYSLAMIRQVALTQRAYQFFRDVEAQSENTGGVADTPPAAPIGNVLNVNKPEEIVVGYFAATGVTQRTYWLDRRDTSGPAWGARNEQGDYLLPDEMLFFALNGRLPSPEPPPPYGPGRPTPRIEIWGGPPRVPTAICLPSDHSTPFRPPGWQP